MSRPTDEEIIDEATSWIGTRWVHAQAVKGAGVDCIHFPLKVYQELGVIDSKLKIPPYPRDWAIHNSESLLEKGLEEAEHVTKVIDDSGIQVGDILVFKTGKTTGHVGICVGEDMMVHAQVRYGVIQEKITKYKDTLSSVWRVR